MNPQKNNMSVLAQISSWIPDRIADNLAKKYKIQTRSFSPFSHVLAMVYAHLAHSLTPHIRPRGEEKKAIRQGYKARRWVVEVAHSWFNRFRKLLVRFEKTTLSYLALLQLAAIIIVLRKIASI